MRTLFKTPSSSISTLSCPFSFILVGNRIHGSIEIIGDFVWASSVEEIYDFNMFTCISTLITYVPLSWVNTNTVNVRYDGKWDI